MISAMFSRLREKQGTNYQYRPDRRKKDPYAYHGAAPATKDIIVAMSCPLSGNTITFPDLNYQ
tara:strand:+ start:22378 stop:22566 length:189 start_codon:yes stop_codon:yes gene_type:complete